MDWQQMLMIALAAISGVLGWFARELYTAVKELRKDLSALEVKISSEYVRYDRLSDALKPIMESLHDIKISLRDKVDKP